MAGQIKRYQVQVNGVVQGVGFRPFVYRLAHHLKLKGWVSNSGVGIEIEIEGFYGEIMRFINDLKANAPLHSTIDNIKIQELPAKDEKGGFEIRESINKKVVATSIPPDIATCDQCLAETLTPGNRRYGYPFTNCTCCGPRFTLIQALPYDRSATTMSKFTMCKHCEQEYQNPGDCRYHAQPIACPDCGPVLSLLKPEIKKFLFIQSDDPIKLACQALKDGAVVAVKGIGGFHLMGNAASEETVQRIRQIKSRFRKPLAIMCKDLQHVESICIANYIEREMLTSMMRPIVLLRQKTTDTSYEIAPSVAPGLERLGVMLPYTPLHQLILLALDSPVVVTSCNREDEPIITDEHQLPEKIRQQLDLILTHNREIWNRCDDSVVIASPIPIIIRRSRGFVPAPVSIPVIGETLGVGADLKNSCCFIRNGQAFLTQYNGEIASEASKKAFEACLQFWKRLYRFEPKSVGCDYHPAFFTRTAVESFGCPVIEVQHHYAHIAACMAENMISEKVIGVAFDGTGFGLDGTIWGGEFLVADFLSFHRLGALHQVVLPGGKQAVREPWRMAVAYLIETFGWSLPWFPGSDGLYSLGAGWIQAMIRQSFNTPASSSAGRLFDAVAAILGINRVASYEGEAAARLESIAHHADSNSPYPWEVYQEQSMLRLDFRPVFHSVIADLKCSKDKSLIANRFHQTVAAGIDDVCQRIRNQTGLTKVVLSGGVFQNTLLLIKSKKLLSDSGFEVITHRLIPPNDGGISLGQAVIAASHFENL